MASVPGRLRGGASGLARFDQTALVGEDDRLDAIAQFQIAQQVGDVDLTVAPPSTSRPATSALLIPRARSRSTSRSRSVSDSSSAAGQRAQGWDT